MRSELFFRFVPGKQEERLFSQTHEVFTPKDEVTLRGYVSGKTLRPMFDAQIGSLKSGAARQISLMVDTGSFATVLSSEDGAYLLIGKHFVKRRSITVLDGITEAGCSVVNTEVWLSGRHSGQDILLAIRLPVYILDSTVPNKNMPAILGRDVLGHFKGLEIDFAKGKVIAKVRGSDRVRTYRKII